MSKKKTEQKQINKIQYEGKQSRKKDLTASGRPRNRKPKYLRNYHKKKKGSNKERRPNKRKRTEPREDQWKCKCGYWNVDELLSCEKCGRENEFRPKEEIQDYDKDLYWLCPICLKLNKNDIDKCDNCDFIKSNTVVPNQQGRAIFNKGGVKDADSSTSDDDG